MSVLYLGSDPDTLADRLADNLQHAKHGDFFTPLTIVVPNRFLRKWLRLHLVASTASPSISTSNISKTPFGNCCKKSIRLGNIRRRVKPIKMSIA